MLLTSYTDIPTKAPVDDPAKEKLRSGVERALYTIQNHFSSPINIEGIDATDLFSMNTLLGSAIEVSIVKALRTLRDVWDPDHEWDDYDFVRFPQSFPDVRLVRCDDYASEPAIGIELKSWFLLSKEGEPSSRFSATAAACAPWDLFCIVPWSLSNVLSGSPVVHSPFVEQAAYVAEARNHYWLNTRTGGSPTDKDAVEVPDGVRPYPSAKSKINDRAVNDQGRNYGRVARVDGLVDDWVADCLLVTQAGIATVEWVRFLKDHATVLTKNDIRRFQAEIGVEMVKEVAYQLLELCDKNS